MNGKRVFAVVGAISLTGALLSSPAVASNADVKTLPSAVQRLLATPVETGISQQDGSLVVEDTGKFAQAESIQQQSRSASGAGSKLEALAAPDKDQAKLAVMKSNSRAKQFDEVTVSLNTTSNGTVIDGRAFFQGANVSEPDFVVTPNRSGTQIAAIVNGPDAPTEINYPLYLPSGTHAELIDDGSIVILDRDYNTVGTFLPPWAKDTAGKSIATRYTIRSNLLVQTIDHRVGEVSYPVVADPAWSYTFDEKPLGDWSQGYSGKGLTLIDLRSMLSNQMSALFPLSGAPNHYPVEGETWNLRVPQGLGIFRAPVKVTWSEKSPRVFWQFTASAGHFDGAGSTISFNFYSDSAKFVHLRALAKVTTDRGELVNWYVSSAAKNTWRDFLGRVARVGCFDYNRCGRT